MSLLRTKSLATLLSETHVEGRSLKKSLRAIDLVAIGIGCIIGVGIFVAPGIEAAGHSGPGIIASFGIAGIACAFAALSYSEFAAMIPVSGSAYTYGYATLGEIFGWVIGWDLILEYMLAAAWVAIGWSGYFTNFVNHGLASFGTALPQAITAGPWGDDPGIFNVPAFAIVMLLTWLLVLGIRESARFNLAIVFVKLAVIIFFIGITVWYVNPDNWTPFMPFGFDGVMTSAAIVFLAYVGFDAVSTAAEEAVNPKRDMPIGILGSLAIASVLYMAVAAIMTGVVPYQQLGVAHPVSLVLDVLGKPWAAMIVDVGAMAGITSVLLVLLLGQPRILFAMSRDGLLPPAFARVHARYKTPHVTTIGTGLVVGLAAGLAPVGAVAELVSIGTLAAFTIVCAGIIVLRYTRKDLPRPFKVPFAPVTPALGVVACLYLVYSLPPSTWVRFGVWLALGLLIYAFYGYWHSAARETAQPAPAQRNAAG